MFVSLSYACTACLLALFEGSSCKLGASTSSTAAVVTIIYAHSVWLMTVSQLISEFGVRSSVMMLLASLLAPKGNMEVIVPVCHFQSSSVA